MAVNIRMPSSGKTILLSLFDETRVSGGGWAQRGWAAHPSVLPLCPSKASSRWHVILLGFLGVAFIAFTVFFCIFQNKNFTLLFLRSLGTEAKFTVAAYPGPLKLFCSLFTRPGWNNYIQQVSLQLLIYLKAHFTWYRWARASCEDYCFSWNEDLAIGLWLLGTDLAEAGWRKMVVIKV